FRIIPLILLVLLVVAIIGIVAGIIGVIAGVVGIIFGLVVVFIVVIRARTDLRGAARSRNIVVCRTAGWRGVGGRCVRSVIVVILGIRYKDRSRIIKLITETLVLVGEPFFFRLRLVLLCEGGC